jgi:ribosomal protein S18
MKDRSEKVDLNFSIQPHEVMSYEGIEKLNPFLTEQKKILSRRSTNLSPKKQKEITKAIKTSRIIGLNSFNASN